MLASGGAFTSTHAVRGLVGRVRAFWAGVRDRWNHRFLVPLKYLGLLCIVLLGMAAGRSREGHQGSRGRLGDADGAGHPGRGGQLRLRHPQADQRAVRRRAGLDRGTALPVAAPARAPRPRGVQLAVGRRRAAAQVLPHHRSGLAELAEQRRQWDTVVDALKEIWRGSGDAGR